MTASLQSNQPKPIPTDVIPDELDEAWVSDEEYAAWLNKPEYQKALAELRAATEAGDEDDLPDDLPELDEPDEGDTLAQVMPGAQAG